LSTLSLLFNREEKGRQRETNHDGRIHFCSSVREDSVQNAFIKVEKAEAKSAIFSAGFLIHVAPQKDLIPETYTQTNIHVFTHFIRIITALY